jgi:hypothetical protein
MEEIVGPGERLRRLAPLDRVRKRASFFVRGRKGGRGRGANTTTFQQEGDEEGDKGVWMSVWVDDVDEMHKHCVAVGLEVTFPPTDMPWNVRSPRTCTTFTHASSSGRLQGLVRNAVLDKPQPA